MERNKLMIAILTSIAFTVGCDKAGTTSRQLDKVREETAATAQDMKDYTFAQKAEFVGQMRVQLAGINKDLDQLEVRVEQSSAAVKVEAKPKFQASREKAAELAKHLDGVENSTESTWESVKAGTRKAYGELKDGLNQALQWVGETVAP